MSGRPSDWREQNQQHLLAELDELYHLLRRRLEHSSASDAPPQPEEGAPQQLSTTLTDVCTLFQLSPFARRLLLMCAALEIDAPRFAALYSELNGAADRAYPTLSMALAVLPEPEWAALLPNAPLRRWRLIEIGTGNTLMLSALRIDERVLHYLVGYSQLDERITPLLHTIPSAEPLVHSQGTIAQHIMDLWSTAATASPMPVVQLCGDDRAGKRAVAAHACTKIGLTLCVLPAAMIPNTPQDVDSFIRLWEREATLSRCALLIECDDLEPADGPQASAALRVAERAAGVTLLSSRERRRSLQRVFVTFDVLKPRSAEQRGVWHTTLGDAAARLNGHVEGLVSQFSLSVRAIHEVSAAASGRLSQGDPDVAAEALWDLCRANARPRLDDLAQRIETTAGWDDIVLPEHQLRVLREIVVHVRERALVYEEWGFGAHGARGLGINALFAGVSGTGKTLAAEVLANVLRLDLYRIDLSSVVSKYIGETEKNLRQIFDAAEEGGAILLFDEADALFGKRSEVRDSHDRYANIEVSYLLQRMESYRGLAILTTNLKHALDTAFLRRLRFIVQFPFPDATQRSAIWRRMFPDQMPRERIDYERLGQLNVPGGNIRTIALRAAFRAAAERAPLRMVHLLEAARSEYSKLENALTDAEIAGWM